MIYSSCLLYTEFMSTLDKENRLAEISAQIANAKMPPVHRWQPSVVGDIDIEIDSQGHWFHEGEPIRREALVRLFASILWFEGGDYYLVTPVEKLRIRVADVPLLINYCECLEGVWVASDNVGGQTIINVDHPVALRDFHGQRIPYIKVRYDLWARVSRSVYVDWVNQALSESDSIANVSPVTLTLTSGDYVFTVAE